MSRRLFMGTGGEGRLYSVQGVERTAGGEVAPVPPLTVTLDHDFDQRQVVGVTGGEPEWATGAGLGMPVVLTTNAAALYRLTERPSASGTYTSAPLDSGLLASYGVFRWSGESPSGTSVRVRFRTGSSATPDASWSPWSAAEQRGADSGRLGGCDTRIGNGRFLQWQAELLGEGGRSPRMQLAEASYRQVNQRPRIDRFGALDPGQILVPANFNPAEQVYEPTGPNREGIFTTLQPATAGGDIRTKQLWKSGQRTLRWRVTDPNGDELRFALEVRAETDPARLAGGRRRPPRGVLRIRRHGAAGRAISLPPDGIGPQRQERMGRGRGTDGRAGERAGGHRPLAAGEGPGRAP